MFAIRILIAKKVQSIDPITCIFMEKFSNSTTMSRQDILKPPVLTGLKSLDKEKFLKTVSVPCLYIPGPLVENLRPILKPYLLKMPKLKPVEVGVDAKILLNPEKILSWEDMEENIRLSFMKVNISKENLKLVDLELSYENWNADDILKAVLPPGGEIARSFSKVGHIIHLNLRDHLLEYKKIIGEILLDKTPAARTVVNKTTQIDSTFRNFEMELICGDNEMVTKVKENNHLFEFDFSKVYWNPRLSTEHQRIVDVIRPGDALFDVFCGVGPFAVPCAKKKCRIFANDLNPECYKWLVHNMTLNKVKGNSIHYFNKDGGEFIETDVRCNLLKLATDAEFHGKVHVTMNLPALALDFIVNFQKLLSNSEITEAELEKVNPLIHVYFFVYGSSPEETAKADFKSKTSLNPNCLDLTYHYVRNISPKKDMVRLSFRLPAGYICGEQASDGEPVAKRSR